MFEQSLLPQTKSRTWTVTAALLGQIAAGSLSTLLIPLVNLEPVPHVRRAAALVTPQRPPSLKPVPPPPPSAAARPPLTPPPKPAPVVREFDMSRLTAPAAIPKHPAIIAEEQPPPAPSAAFGRIEGLPGGVPDTADSELPPPPPPPPAEIAETAPQRLKIGGRLQAARLIHRVVPMYPPLARQAHIQGTVQLSAIISREGRITELKLVSGNPLLAPAAVDAVKRWKYTPTYLNGKPVEVETDISIIFTLRTAE